jgi:hypothetical protein
MSWDICKQSFKLLSKCVVNPEERKVLNIVFVYATYVCEIKILRCAKNLFFKVKIKSAFQAKTIGVVGRWQLEKSLMLALLQIVMGWHYLVRTQPSL